MSATSVSDDLKGTMLKRMLCIRRLEEEIPDGEWVVPLEKAVLPQAGTIVREIRKLVQ